VRMSRYFRLAQENAVLLPMVRPVCMNCGTQLAQRQPGGPLETRYCSFCFFRPKKFTSSELRERIILSRRPEPGRGAGQHRIFQLGEKRP